VTLLTLNLVKSNPSAGVPKNPKIIINAEKERNKNNQEPISGTTHSF
jgi:hypothetical protein